MKKLALIILSSVLLFNSLALPLTTLAQQNPVQSYQETLSHDWYAEQNFFNWYAKVYDKNSSPPSEIFGERYTAAQVQWILYGLISHVFNFVPGNPELTICATKGEISNCLDVFFKYWDALNPFSQNINSNNSLADITNFIGKNPISGVYYVKNLVNKFSFVKEVEAQGFGYNNGASSIQAIWRVSRNLSYTLIVFVVIIMAFMIMFQVKINPQVVITVQSSLPKLIGALILITFSYAIAGLAIDLMYLSIGVVSSFITGAGLTNHNFTQLFESFTTSNDVFTLLYKYWGLFLVASISTIGTSSTGMSILLIIFAILAFFAIVWWSIKIIFSVFKNFALIVLTIIIGPLEIMMGIINSSSGFGSWFKKLISLLVFYPVMGFMFFLSFFFLFQGIGDGGGDTFATIMPFNPKINVISNNPWTPPLSKLAVTGNSDSIMWIIISFMIISQITKVSEMIQALIQHKPFAYGTGINEAQSAARSIGGAAENISQYQGFSKTGGKGVQGIVNALKWLAVLIPK